MVNIADNTPENEASGQNITSRQIECLRDFMLAQRYQNLRSRLELRTRYMVMCLEDIYYPHNASAVIRSSEAFGIQEMHAVESYTNFRPSRHVVRGTDRWIDLHRWDSLASLTGHLRERGYRIVATSPREGGRTPDDFDIERGKFALFMGTEKTGISEELINQADDFIQIPMVGFAESLNISASAAIIAQRLTSRIRESGLDWQLAPQDQEDLLLRWMKSSVRDSANILRLKGFQ